MANPSWYDDADAYDIVYDADTHTDVVGLLQIAKRYGDGKLERVLEPACGSGRLVRGFAARGLRVTGFDLNPHMVAYARQRSRDTGLRARVVEADMRDFSLGRRFDLAHCLISSFLHLSSERDARAHLGSIAHALRPGGLYVVGLHLTDYDDRAESTERWTQKRGGVEVSVELTAGVADRRRRRVKMRLRMSVSGRGVEARTVQSQWWFRTYDAEQVRKLLRTADAFDLAGVSDFDFRERELGGERLDTVLVLRRR